MPASNPMIAPSRQTPGVRNAVRLRPAQSSSAQEYFGLSDFFRILRRRWILIATLTLGGLFLTGVVLANITPKYSSTATVVVKLPDADLPSAEPFNALSPNQETQIDTKVEMLQSRRLARKTATTLQLDNDPEFGPASGKRQVAMNWVRGLFIQRPPYEPDAQLRAKDAQRRDSESVADRLLDAVEVSRVGRSSAIRVTATSRDPEKAALIANRFVDNYMQGQVSNAREEHDEAIASLSARVAQVRSELQQADGAAAGYRAQKGLLVSNPEVGSAAQVAQSAGLLVQARGESALDSQRARIGSANAATSPLLIELRQQEAQVSRRLSDLNALYGSAYPDVMRVKAELATLAPRIAQESGRVQSEMMIQSAASQARSGAVSAGINALKAQGLSSGVAAVQLKGIERKADATNALYLSLVNLMNAKLAQPGIADADITFISRASLPTLPSYPIPQRILAVAFLGFLLLGVIIAFVVDSMDTTIRTTAQVKRLLGIPTLAMVPYMGKEYGSGEVHELVEAKPRSRFAEAMRNLLIELESRHEGGSHVVLVTSPLDGEGKSTIATSLAAAASAAGRRAIVVDFDLRRPGISPVMEVQANNVVNYLSGKAGLDDLPVIQQGEHFETIAVGDTPFDPGSLIVSPRLPMMVKSLRSHYDFVILNAPPILPVRDAKTLTEYADSTLLVLRWGFTNPEAARVAMEMFERPIAGAVINMVDFQAHARRRYGDAIHHVANLTKYYDPVGPSETRTWLERLRHNLRRSKRRAAEALHFN